MKIFFLVFFGLLFLNSNAIDVNVLSPDNRIQCIFSVSDGGRIQYKIKVDDVVVLHESQLGILIDSVSFGKHVKIISAERSSQSQIYSTRGVHAVAKNEYRQAILNIMNLDNNQPFQLIVRLYNDGVAFRYVIPGHGLRSVTGEETTWSLPANGILWYNTDYEELHQKTLTQDLREGSAVMPITIELKDQKVFMSVSEGDLVNYCGSRFGFASGSRLKLEYFGQPVMKDKIITPWRLTIITKDLNGLVNSDMVTNVCPPPQAELKNALWTKPGRAVWSWWADETVGPEEQKRYADMGSKLGFEYNLIDGGWESWPDAWKSLADVINYSAKKNIKIWVWKHSKDLTDKNKRIAFFKRVKSLGVVGVKIDFFPPENKETIDYYTDILKDAAAIKLMVNFHGTNKPTGLSRTWPNLITQEGIRGQEWHILRYNRTEPFDLGTILPFTRFVVGPGDYTPCALVLKELRGFSWPHEYAEAVIFTSPIQHFADDPKYYLESPGKELLKTMPSAWDETIVLPGSKIGELAAYARRKGNIWYVAVLNADKERSLSISLSFLGKGDWNVIGFSDNPGKEDDMIREDKKVNKEDSLVLRLRPGGGYVARLMK